LVLIVGMAFLRLRSLYPRAAIWSNAMPSGGISDPAR